MTRSARCPAWFMLVALTLMTVLMATSVTDAAGKSRAKQPATTASGWKLVFEDDFNGGALDERKWTSEFPWGRDRSSVGELQYYAPDAFSLDSGRLSIIAKPTSGGSHAYDSGLISSHKTFAPEFGRFEIRCKIPRGKGLWPAFWLLPFDEDGDNEWDWPPEIDVFEALGQETERIHMTFHWLENDVPKQNGEEFVGSDFSRDFHTYAVEWDADKLLWFIDGVKRHEVKGKSPRGPMYLLANMAVGGPDTWPGAPDASTQFPAMFEIDYIRAYSATPAPSASEGKVKKKHKHHRKKKKHRKRRRVAGAGPDLEDESFS